MNQIFSVIVFFLFVFFVGCSNGDTGTKDPTDTEVTDSESDTDSTNSDSSDTDLPPAEDVPTQGQDWSPLPKQVQTRAGYSIVAVGEGGAYLLIGGYNEDTRLQGAILAGYLYDNSGAEVAVIGIDPVYSSGEISPLIGDINGDGELDMLFPGGVQNPETFQYTSGYLGLLGPVNEGVVVLGAEQFQASPSAVGIWNNRLVRADTFPGAYLKFAQTGDLGGDGAEDLIGVDWGGTLYMVESVTGTVASIVPSGAAGGIQILLGDFNRDGAEDLMVNNPAENIGFGNVAMQAPQIFWGPIDFANPPTWADGEKFWPGGYPWEAEYLFPVEIIGLLPPLPDGTGCWLVSGLTWVTDTGANWALGRMCANPNWTPEGLVTAPSSGDVFLNHDNTVVIGNRVYTALDRAGPQNPADYFRRTSGVFLWDLADLLPN